MGLQSRRRFVRGSLALVALGLLAGCGMLPPQPQPARKVPRLGFLAPGSPPPDTQHHAFLRALRDLGYVEGESLAVEYRWAEEREERLPALAAELVQLDVDVILAAGPPPARVAKDATSTIPIIVPASIDAVEIGLVASLAHPGGNVTGLSWPGSAMDIKRLELLKEAVANVSRVAVLAAASALNVEREWDRTRDAARALGLDPRRYDVQASEDFEGAFSAMAGTGAEALLVLVASFFSRNRATIVGSAAKAHLPAIYEHRLFTDAGGLMSYGPDLNDLYRRAAVYVDKVLKGAKPADLPVEQPTKFDFVINLKAAEALGLTIPREVLIQATEVIQ